MGLGLRAAAKELGISHVALLKAVRAGRVKRGPDMLLDVEECRAALELNSHPGKQKAARSQQSSGQGPAARGREEGRQEGVRSRESGVRSNAPAEEPAESKEIGTYNDALTAKERLRVEELRLKLARQKGELAQIGEINAWIAGMIVRARDILLRIPGELRDRLAQEDDPVKIEEMLSEEVNRSLRELAEYG